MRELSRFDSPKQRDFSIMTLCDPASCDALPRTMRIRGPRVPINLLTNGGRKCLNLTTGLRRYGFIKNLLSFLCKPNPVECLSAANDRSRRKSAIRYAAQRQF